jgi:hypothetical protein
MTNWQTKNNSLQNTTQKTKDLSSTYPTKTGRELRCFGRVNSSISSCSTSSNRRVAHVTNVISHEWEKGRIKYILESCKQLFLRPNHFPSFYYAYVCTHFYFYGFLYFLVFLCFFYVFFMFFLCFFYVFFLFFLFFFFLRFSLNVVKSQVQQQVNNRTVKQPLNWQ